jgi:acyl-coenzyme A thioesterase PaaI-like protein
VRRPVLEHPPADHVLRELGLEIDVQADGVAHGFLAVGDSIRTPSGEPRMGAVATAVDVLGGVTSIRACSPDRVATADMTLHLLPTGGTDELHVVMHVRRRGRRTLVVEAELFGDRRQPAGLATLTFAVLPQPPGAPVLAVAPPGGGRRPAVVPAVEATRPFVDAVGLRVAGPGDVQVDVAPKVRNSLGALNGGVLTTCIDEAVATAGTATLGRPAETTELHIVFLELGRVGPVRARAEVLAGPTTPLDDRVTTTVVVTDEGNGGEVLTRATGVAVAR